MDDAFAQISRCALGQQAQQDGSASGPGYAMLGWVAIYIASYADAPPGYRRPILSLLRQP